MKKHTPTLVSSIVALGVGLLTSTTLLANQQQLVASMAELRAEANRTHAQLESTLAALNALTGQAKGDLRPAYDAFAAEIPKTQAAADATLKRSAWMGGDGQKYFNGWQADIDSIANESLKKKAQKRLDAMQKKYSKVAEALTRGSEKFKPFLSDLSDIQKTLANDVTPAGVKAIKSTVNSANWNYKAVNSAIDNALEELGKMEKELSSEK